MKKEVNTDLLPLLLLFSFFILLGGFAEIYYWVRWDLFGITDGINPYYLQFGSMWKSNLYILREIGIVADIFLGILVIGSIWIVVETVRMLLQLKKQKT